MDSNLSSEEPKKFKCNICSKNTDRNILFLREMMFGFRNMFQYFHCNECDSIQISEPPTDLEIYYPKSGYYSLSSSEHKDIEFFNNLFARVTYKGQGLFFLIAKRAGVIDRQIASISRLHLSSNTKILDVGSGGGALLSRLSHLGFRNITGIDPYLIHNISKKGDIKLLKGDLSALETGDNYDLIMFHHSLEHMNNPHQTLKLAASHLSQNGTIIVRMPILAYAFQKYGVNWYSLDPPRHLNITSLNGARILSRNAGLDIYDYYFDSGPEQFFNSEAYSSNIALSEIPNPGFYRKIAKQFISKKYQDYRKFANELNKSDLGDQAVFYLKPKLKSSK